MDGSLARIVWNLARNLLGIFVGTAGIVGYRVHAAVRPDAHCVRRRGAGDPDSAQRLPGRRHARLGRSRRAAALLGFDFLRSRLAAAASLRRRRPSDRTFRGSP